MSSDGDLSFGFLEAHPADAARVLGRLPSSDAAAFLADVPARLAAPVMQYMQPLHAANCLVLLDDDVAAGALHALGAQPAIAILRHISEARRTALIARLPTTMTIAFRLLLGYSSNAVGAWMDPAAIAVPADFRCDEALMRVRESERDYSQVYVLDGQQRLRGAVDVTRLLRATANMPVGALIRAVTPALPALASLATVRDHPGWGEQRMLPVIERGERFVGALRFTVMTSALVDTPAAHGGTPGDVIEELAEAYWVGVSSLIEAVVGSLPVEQPRTRSTDHA